ncbi:hypothetical protein HT031_000075 [Scenedesmus sp. PABB004]|nr:hypothetical protein HT031_000075 [Scenedesmus sp. PABB004]
MRSSMATSPPTSPPAPAAERGSLHALPAPLLDAIAARLEPAAVPAARLACRALAAACAQRVTALRLRGAPPAAPPTAGAAARLAHVTALAATVRTPAEWCALAATAAAALPALTTLALDGRRTWARMATGGAAPPPALPRLRALRVRGTLRGLADVAALAPGLRHLAAGALHLPAPPDAALPGLTHLGAGAVHVEAADGGEAADAWGAAFPGLRCVFEAPEFAALERYATFSHLERVPLGAALRRCPALEALRAYGDATAACGALPGQLARLGALRRLSVHGCGPAAELRGVGRLTQLTHVRLSFELPAKKAAAALLAELAGLRLAALALPAKLLCGRCCPGMAPHVEALVAPRRGGGAALGELVLLEREADPRARRQAGDHCAHGEALRAAAARLAAAAAAPAPAPAPAGDSAEEAPVPAAPLQPTRVTLQRVSFAEGVLHPSPDDEGERGGGSSSPEEEDDQEEEEEEGEDGAAGGWRDALPDGDAGSVWGLLGPRGDW